MKNNDFEKYITELSPELQEKARQCKDKDELNELLAENDVELSEDALEVVAGGGSCNSCSDPKLSTGDTVDLKCTECGGTLHYWDCTAENGNRYYCDNGACVACQENWLFDEIFNSNGNSSVSRIK